MLFNNCSKCAKKTFQIITLNRDILLIFTIISILAMPFISLGSDSEWLPLKGNAKVGVNVYLHDGTYHARVTEIDEATGEITISMEDGTTVHFPPEITDQLRFKVRSDDPALDIKKK